MEPPGKPLLRFSNNQTERDFGKGPITLELVKHADGNEINVRDPKNEIIGWAKYSLEDRKVSLDHLHARKESWHVGTSIITAIASLEPPLPIVVQPDAFSRSYYEHIGFTEHPLEKGKLWIQNREQLSPQDWVERTAQGKRLRKFFIEKVKGKDTR